MARGMECPDQRPARSSRSCASIPLTLLSHGWVVASVVMMVRRLPGVVVARKAPGVPLALQWFSGKGCMRFGGLGRSARSWALATSMGDVPSTAPLRQKAQRVAGAQCRDCFSVARNAPLRVTERGEEG